MATSAGTAAVAAASSINAEDLSAIASAALNVLGSAVAVLPFLAPIQLALRDLGTAVTGAVYNREAARMLTQRCADCSMLVHEMAPKIKTVSIDLSEAERLVQPLVAAINECSVFLSQFTKKGFLFQMMSATRDTRSMSLLDKKVTDAVQNMSVRINGKQMDLQMADSSKLDAIMALVASNLGNAPITNPASISPELIAKIAQQAGCTTKEALSEELQGVGMTLKDISSHVDQVMSTLASFGGKMDHVVDKVDEMADKIDERLKATQERDENMKQMIMQFQSQQTHQSAIALSAMRALAEKSGAKIKEVFSTKAEAESLSKKAIETVIRGGILVIPLHAHGVGVKTRQSVEGRHGDHGTAGRAGRDGGNGRNGNSGAMDGADGEDGDDGEFQ
jgi:hypothetical protein